MVDKGVMGAVRIRRSWIDSTESAGPGRQIRENSCVAGVMTRSLGTRSRESVQDQAEQEIVESSLSEIECSGSFQEHKTDLHTTECMQDQAGNVTMETTESEIIEKECNLFNSANYILLSVSNTQGDFTGQNMYTRTKEKPTASDLKNIEVLLEVSFAQSLF